MLRGTRIEICLEKGLVSPTRKTTLAYGKIQQAAIWRGGQLIKFLQVIALSFTGFLAFSLLILYKFCIQVLMAHINTFKNPQA